MRPLLFVMKTLRRLGCVLRALRTGRPVVAWEDGLSANAWLSLTTYAAGLHYRFNLHRRLPLQAAMSRRHKRAWLEVTRLDASVIALTIATLPLAMLTAGAIAFAFR